MPKATGDFPKILFVHDYQPEARLVADLIRQILLGYPADKINWWHFRHTPLYEHPDLHAAAVYGFHMPEKLVPHKRLTHIKAGILDTLWMPLAARHLERTIATVKPDLVVVLLSALATNILQRFRVPSGQRLHVSLWDLPDTNGNKKMLGAARGRRLTTAAFKLVRQATTIDACGPALIDEIEVQTGRTDGVLLLSGFEPRHLEALKSAPAGPVSDDVIRIAYVGTIISEASFLKILSALKNVRPAVQKKVVLEFYGGRNYSRCSWFDPEWMVEHPMFTDQGLIESLRRCDWGIVVQDLDLEDPQYSSFSWPNKVGTCLSAGVPVLGFGHPQSCIVKMMQQHRFGQFTCATDLASLEKFLLELFQISDPRALFRQDILQCAFTEFNAAEMRTRLWRLWGATGL